LRPSPQCNKQVSSKEDAKSFLAICEMLRRLENIKLSFNNLNIKDESIQTSIHDHDVGPEIILPFTYVKLRLKNNHYCLIKKVKVLKKPQRLKIPPIPNNMKRC
ncbi:hypothetical protein T10_4587, partial [Trichinella papuae]